MGFFTPRSQISFGHLMTRPWEGPVVQRYWLNPIDLCWIRETNWLKLRGKLSLRIEDLDRKNLRQYKRSLETLEIRRDRYLRSSFKVMVNSKGLGSGFSMFEMSFEGSYGFEGTVISFVESVPDLGSGSTACLC